MCKLIKRFSNTITASNRHYLVAVCLASAAPQSVLVRSQQARCRPSSDVLALGQPSFLYPQSPTRLHPSAKPPLTLPIMRSRTWMLRTQQLKNMRSHKHRPGETTNDYQHPAPVRNCPVCNDEPSVSADRGRYDAVPVGVRVCV